jgi:hypothetical protein
MVYRCAHRLESQWFCMITVHPVTGEECDMLVLSSGFFLGYFGMFLLLSHLLLLVKFHFTMSIDSSLG